MTKNSGGIESFFQDRCKSYSPNRSKPTGEVSSKTGAVYTCKNWARGKILDTVMGESLTGDCTGCAVYEEFSQAQK